MMNGIFTESQDLRMMVAKSEPFKTPIKAVNRGSPARASDHGKRIMQADDGLDGFLYENRKKISCLVE